MQHYKRLFNMEKCYIHKNNENPTQKDKVHISPFNVQKTDIYLAVNRSFQLQLGRVCVCEVR